MQKSSRREFPANAVHLSLCTFFFEKKVRKKAIQEAHPPERPPVKVQGGTSLPRRFYQSKGGSTVRILKGFLIVRSFCACGDGGKQGLFIFSNSANNVGGGICKRTKSKRSGNRPFLREYKILIIQLLKILLPSFLLEERNGTKPKRSGEPPLL